MQTFHGSKTTLRELCDFEWSGLDTFKIIAISPNSNIFGIEWEGKFFMNKTLLPQLFATL